ncbi:glycoside-pentoside-hexuronide (GPH):cation symporter [Brachybacterium saurashtrense]|uniref:MFS transporter n=1 Tax=Brachybacterium saurashtrense TaxID=556288 RepID=A0A345YT19_9MICO|nr:glycoside-pentoside-hexuronide (GPH):cation symporter [Brachybacterium saurashtrense]AXK47071.1 MFS transporter [Brachybacterium saurashtrense]RRR20920.1 MFS transporter [Brachybacterium saurashtrense]
MSDTTHTPPAEAATATKLRPINVLAYGAGDAANSLAFLLASIFLLVYYTDVAGISAAAAGTLLLVVRIFDGIGDLIAGRVVDRTSTRFGKFRPVIAVFAIPLLLLSIATFSVPQIGESGALLYAYLTYAGLSLAYSFVNIPYGSLAGAMTQVPTERAKLATARTVAGTIVGGVIAMVVAPLLTPDRDLQQLFTTITIVFLGIGVVLYAFMVLFTKEVVERDVPKVTLKQSIEVLRTNRPLLILSISTFVFLVGTFAQSTAMIYYMRDVMEALNVYSLNAGIGIVTVFLLAPLTPTIVRRIGKKTGYLMAISFMGLGGLILLLAPAGVWWMALIGLVLGGAGIKLTSMLIWALEADTVEYGEWRTGVRAEGITYALFSFVRKLGQAVGGAVAAYAIAWGGYEAGTAVVGTSVEWGVRAAVGGIPLLMALLSIVVMIAYKLTDERHSEIVTEIKARRAERSVHAAE